MPTKTKTKTASAAPEIRPTITLAKGGTRERRVALAALQIPDLFYCDDGTGRILETWHLAHDLKRELFETFAFIQRWHEIIIGDALRGELEPWARAFDKEAKALLTK